MISKAAELEIKKAAIKNALGYGKARESTVINGVLSKFPELRSEMRELALRAKAETERVNALGADELKREADEYSEEFRAHEEERAARTAKPKMELPGATKGSFVTRFPPEPNGYMQIGHAKVCFMEREFADIYEGSIGLYFDDTNPEVEKQEFVDAFKKDLEWLGIRFDTEYYASDNIRMMYDHAQKLISGGWAYVCACSPETVKENRSASKECEHRANTAERNLKMWEDMLAGGALDATESRILRLRAEMSSENTAMRDPTLFRIKKQEHYRQGKKYAVWPTYDFNTPIMDSAKGVTDAIRSKEYELRDEVYYRILDLLGLRKPRIHSVARLEIENNMTSKRKINELISRKLLWGYDDPRLVTIAGLRRRGIAPRAIREFVMRFGMSKSDSKVKIEMLLAENRKLIENTSKRLFFIRDPKKIEVRGIPKAAAAVKIRAHPTVDLGYREYNLDSVFFINAYDAINLKKGDRVRLKDAFDIKISGVEDNSITASYINGVDKDSPKLQWVNEGGYVKGKAIIIGDLLHAEAFNKESMVVVEGLVESHLLELRVGDTVQLERLGFFKLDSKEENVLISI